MHVRLISSKRHALLMLASKENGKIRFTQVTANGALDLATLQSDRAGFSP
jgi:hypothetical protein